MLAGPNGAGKSTFYETHLSGLGLPFLNADVLADKTGMNAYDAAGQIAEARRVLIRRRIGFVTETVLSDPVGEKVQLLVDAAALGFDVHLVYIGIADANMSAERVKSRVAAGGHDVPIAKILARYARSMDNLERAIRQRLRVTVYDNSSFADPYRLIAEFAGGQVVKRCGSPVSKWARRFLGKDWGDRGR